MNERLGAPIYLPHGYDGQKPMPLVILLAEAGQTGAQVMAEMNFRDLADREGFIVAAPNDVRIRTAGLVESFVEDLREHFCFDADRVYLVGHGVGSDVADRLRNPDMFAAIVVTSHRLRHSEMANRIEVETRVPYMMLTPRDDEQAPLAGNDEVVSLADQEGQLRIEHDCEDGPTVTRRKGATCTSWTCATPLVSCAIQGNRHWPDYQHPTKDERGAPSTFAHQVEIWDFLNKFRRVRAPPADCGKSWEPGRADIDGDVVYVPKGYRSDRRHPVIIALPEDNQTPAGLLEELGLDSLADEHQVILYAANSPERGSGEGRSWRIDVTSKTIGRYNQVVARLFESFCIDGTKMFVVGHGASGPFVESLRANRRLAAAATFSHRPTRREHDAFFPREARVPYLYISPLDDPLDPPDGDARVISVEAAEARLMEPFDCDETSPQSHDVEGCRTWTCTTDLVTCRIDGGRHWPGHPEGKASRFPHGKVLMDFFLTHPRASRD